MHVLWKRPAATGQVTVNYFSAREDATDKSKYTNNEKTQYPFFELNTPVREAGPGSNFVIPQSKKVEVLQKTYLTGTPTTKSVDNIGYKQLQRCVRVPVPPNAHTLTDQKDVQAGICSFAEKSMESVMDEFKTKNDDTAQVRAILNETDILKNSLLKLGKGERKICIIGPTGMGKSSLLNALLGESLAVTAGSGTAVTACPSEFYYWNGESDNNGEQCIPASKIITMMRNGASSSSSSLNPNVASFNGLTNIDDKTSEISRCPNSSAIVDPDFIRILKVVFATTNKISVDSPILAKELANIYPTYKVTLKFISKPEFDDLIDGECCDAVSNDATTETLRMLYGNEKAQEAMDLYRRNIKHYKRQNPNAGDEMIELKSRIALKTALKITDEQIAADIKKSEEREQKANKNNNAANTLNFISRVRKIQASGLVGRTLTDEVCSLLNLRECEHKFAPILEKISIGSTFEALQVPGIEEGSLKLVDVPGFGDNNGLREKVADACLNHAHKIIVCTSSVRASSDKQTKEYLLKDKIRSLSMKNAGRGNIIFVATKGDQAKLSEIQQVIAKEEQARKMDRLGSKSSAKKASKSVNGGDDDDFFSSDDEDDDKENDSTNLNSNSKNTFPASSFSKDARLRLHNHRIVRTAVEETVKNLNFDSDVPVAVISAERYQALNKMKKDESSAPEYSTAEMTEVPQLMNYIVESVFSDRLTEVDKRFEKLVAHVDKVQLAEEDDLDEKLEKNSEEEREKSQKAVKDAVEFVKSQEEPENSPFKVGLLPIKTVLDEIKNDITQASNTADSDAPNTSQGWSYDNFKGKKIHWGTHGAILRRGGKFKDFDWALDLYRPFRNKLDNGDSWRKFFTEYEAKLSEFKEIATARVKDLVTEVQNKLPEHLKKEIGERFDKLGSDALAKYALLSENLKDRIRGFQDKLELPKEKISDSLGDEWIDIESSEKGSGCFGRRISRVESSCALGCNMNDAAESFVAELDILAQEIDDFPKKIKDDAARALETVAARGSWCVDKFEVCSICLDEDKLAEGSTTEFATLFRCAHRFCKDCLFASLAQNSECPKCRGKVSEEDKDLICISKPGLEKLELKKKKEELNAGKKLDASCMEKIKEKVAAVRLELQAHMRPVLQNLDGEVGGRDTALLARNNTNFSNLKNTKTTNSTAATGSGDIEMGTD